MILEKCDDGPRVRDRGAVQGVDELVLFLLALTAKSNLESADKFSKGFEAGSTAVILRPVSNPLTNIILPPIKEVGMQIKARSFAQSPTALAVLAALTSMLFRSKAIVLDFPVDPEVRTSNEVASDSH